jgi:hypothetical protein
LFQKNRKEILNAIRKNRFKMESVFIEATPKRLHNKLGGNNFRGSKYRGVSKNKNKWQVSIYFQLFNFLDDDHG